VSQGSPNAERILRAADINRHAPLVPMSPYLVLHPWISCGNFLWTIAQHILKDITHWIANRVNFQSCSPHHFIQKLLNLSEDPPPSAAQIPQYDTQGSTPPASALHLSLTSYHHPPIGLSFPYQPADVSLTLMAALPPLSTFTFFWLKPSGPLNGLHLVNSYTSVEYNFDVTSTRKLSSGLGHLLQDSLHS
jgi:hypothetical protein